jgi:hypothetical protein
MNPKPRNQLAERPGLKRLAGAFRMPSRKRSAEGWMRRRRPTLQPWLRGRIRPSNCHDRKAEA